MAIVGRPNVGKSTLFNRLVGEDRSVVHDLAGTTRDAIDTLVETEDGPIVFVDTAGMRRRSRIDDSAEYYSLVRALRAIDDADIALLVIDATEGVTGQDQRLAERIDAAGCPILILLNKWELIDDPDDRLAILAELSRKLAFIGDAPVLKISALTGKGVHKLRPVLQDAIGQYHRRVPTTRRQPGARRGPAALAGRRRGQGAVRRAGRHRPADVHAVRQPGAPADRTCATSSARSARRSASARRRSSCGCGSGTADDALVRRLREVLGAVGDDAGGRVPDLRRRPRGAGAATAPTPRTTKAPVALQAARRAARRLPRLPRLRDVLRLTAPSLDVGVASARTHGSPRVASATDTRAVAQLG